MEASTTDGNMGVEIMCDYSMHLVTHRAASVGDKLISTRFDNTSTRGFAAAGESGVAVCVPPGTELAFESEVSYRGGIWSLGLRKTAGTVARFRNINRGQSCAYHDALEFPNGEIVMLTDLLEGQRATVLQLPVDRAQETRAQETRPADATEDRRQELPV
jgi:hypothetical protein